MGAAPRRNTNNALHLVGTVPTGRARAWNSRRLAYPISMNREFVYIDVGEPHTWDIPLSEAWEWGRFWPIAPCERCGKYTEDHTRDNRGQPMPEHVWDSEEDLEIVCMVCLDKAAEREAEQNIIETLEHKLGLEEKHRDALRAFIETIFTDPKKILKVQDLDNRVASLEKQLNITWAIMTGVVIVLLVAIATSLVGS
jgi:hypothetical protein